jgi:hypothetical protein
MRQPDRQADLEHQQPKGRPTQPFRPYCDFCEIGLRHSIGPHHERANPANDQAQREREQGYTDPIAFAQLGLNRRSVGINVVNGLVLFLTFLAIVIYTELMREGNNLSRHLIALNEGAQLNCDWAPGGEDRTPYVNCNNLGKTTATDVSGHVTITVQSFLDGKVLRTIKTQSFGGSDKSEPPAADGVPPLQFDVSIDFSKEIPDVEAMKNIIMAKGDYAFDDGFDGRPVRWFCQAFINDAVENQDPNTAPPHDAWKRCSDVIQLRPQLKRLMEKRQQANH